MEGKQCLCAAGRSVQEMATPAKRCAGDWERDTSESCHLRQLGRFVSLAQDERHARELICNLEQGEWWALLVGSKLTLTPEKEQGQRKRLRTWEQRTRRALHAEFLSGVCGLKRKVRETDRSFRMAGLTGN